jgi:hypothetical protein|tara:strand:- start:52 stop:642 length:591 start_codon:yes stop_codon:yes gene_type:complete
MSKEAQARDVALSEYNKFMDKYKAGVEAGNMKLMQHMLRLEADKIRTQSILDAIEKSEAGIDSGVYDFEESKMKIQMDSEEYARDQAREQAFVKMATKDTTKEVESTPAPISIGDPDKMDSFRLDAMDFGQIAKAEPKNEVKPVVKKKEAKPVITIDPETGRKVYNGPKLRNKRIVDGKEWDESHPNFMDKGVGGM